MRNDLAWRNLKHKLPLTRYTAWCLALGLMRPASAADYVSDICLRECFEIRF